MSGTSGALPRCAQAGSQPRPSFWLVAPIVSMAAFMEVLDISIANVALQHIAGDLAAGQDESTWVLTSYLVTNAIVLPLSGWLSTLLGRKRFFLACIAGFSVSSLMCGLAPNLAALICCRAVQGLTGGGLQPGAQAILNDEAPPAQRAMAFALFGMAVVAAPAIGPTLGGWITDNYSWRWIFLLNVPVGIALLLFLSALISDPPDFTAERRRRLSEGIRVDYVGFGLLAVGLGSLQIVLDRGQQDDWFGSSFILLMAIAAGLGLLLFTVWELLREDPIVDLRLFGNRSFAVANVLMLMLGFVLFGTTVLLPEMVQQLYGYTATDAGLVISPGGFTILVLLPLVGRLLGKIDVRLIIGAGVLASAAALYHLGGFWPGSSYLQFMWARVYQAVGIAFLFIPISTVAFADLPRSASSNAAALINLSRNIGASIGISVVTTMLARSEQAHQVTLVEHVTALDPVFRERLDQLITQFSAAGLGPVEALHHAQALIYQQVQQQAQLLSFLDDFRWLALAFLALLPLVLLLKPLSPGTAAPLAH